MACAWDKLDMDCHGQRGWPNDVANVCCRPTSPLTSQLSFAQARPIHSMENKKILRCNQEWSWIHSIREALPQHAPVYRADTKGNKTCYDSPIRSKHDHITAIAETDQLQNFSRSLLLLRLNGEFAHHLLHIRQKKQPTLMSSGSCWSDSSGTL